MRLQALLQLFFDHLIGQMQVSELVEVQESHVVYLQASAACIYVHVSSNTRRGSHTPLGCSR